MGQENTIQSWFINPVDVKKLSEDAYSPEDWLKHLVKDLLPYWEHKDAVGFQGDLFPTYRMNNGELLPEDESKWSKEFIAAKNDPETSGLVETEYNFIRAHSRQTYAYGIAFHMTGKEEYLDLCRKGALALINAMDSNYGMFTRQNKASKQWGEARNLRTSQDLAYGITGLGMYYFLTHDKSVMYKIIQIKDYIFKFYFDEGKDFITWYPKYEKSDKQVQIVSQLDQLYAYMLMITPSLPEPYQSIWKQDIKRIVDVLINQFFSEKYGFFWGVEDESSMLTLGSDHTDFGHSVKTLWVILKAGELLGETSYVTFARPKIDAILKMAYLQENGSWARRFNKDGSLDIDKEWWILAELDQACQILSLHDPAYYEYLNNTHKYWFTHMVDKKYGEIHHMVDGKTNEPVLKYPKVHNWKTSLHSFEHALFGYMTSSRIKNSSFTVYYALPRYERVSHRTVAPYMFSANITAITKKQLNTELPDSNLKYEIIFDSLH